MRCCSRSGWRLDWRSLDLPPPTTANPTVTAINHLTWHGGRRRRLQQAARQGRPMRCRRVGLLPRGGRTKRQFFSRKKQKAIFLTSHIPAFNPTAGFVEHAHDDLGVWIASVRPGAPVARRIIVEGRLYFLDGRVHFRRQAGRRPQVETGEPGREWPGVRSGPFVGCRRHGRPVVL